jgi:hypothetical protein
VIFPQPPHHGVERHNSCCRYDTCLPHSTAQCFPQTSAPAPEGGTYSVLMLDMSQNVCILYIVCIVSMLLYCWGVNKRTR